MHNDAIQRNIEALLFYRAEPVAIRRLAAELSCAEWEIADALNRIENDFAARGIRLVRKDDLVEFRTAPEASDLVERVSKEELAQDLGKAALETLTIILYRAPITKSDIDYIRGVNSNFILRSLLIRGLVERIPNQDSPRSFLYRPTIDLLSYLGVSKIEDLPEYEMVKEEMKKFEEAFRKESE